MYVAYYNLRQLQYRIIPTGRRRSGTEVEVFRSPLYLQIKTNMVFYRVFESIRDILEIYPECIELTILYTYSLAEGKIYRSHKLNVVK